MLHKLLLSLYIEESPFQTDLMSRSVISRRCWMLSSWVKTRTSASVRPLCACAALIRFRVSLRKAWQRFTGGDGSAVATQRCRPGERHPTPGEHRPATATPCLLNCWRRGSTASAPSSLSWWTKASWPASGKGSKNEPFINADSLPGRRNGDKGYAGEKLHVQEVLHIIWPLGEETRLLSFVLFRLCLHFQ